MRYSSYDIKQFYNSRTGKLVRRLISAHLYQYWPDLNDMRVAGYGYPMPYLRERKKHTERSIALVPADQGMVAWDSDHGNLSCAVGDSCIALENESVDRLLIIHGLEFSQMPDALLGEMWRVLKSGGRMIIIVPNRLGLWARHENAPFGHGRPYTLRQVEALLHNHNFQIEKKGRALYMPPFRSFLMLRSAYSIEGFGKYLFPALHGLHVIEASKKIYAGILKDTQKNKGKAQRISIPEPYGS